jgi:hypothetical protein
LGGASNVVLVQNQSVDGIESQLNVYRSFRRGSDSKAIEQGLDKTVTDNVNRWKVLEGAGVLKPGHGSMSQYYTDASKTIDSTSSSDTTWRNTETSYQFL